MKDFSFRVPKRRENQRLNNGMIAIFLRLKKKD